MAAKKKKKAKAKTTTKAKTKTKAEAANELKQSARRIWLAGLGALAVAEAEGSKVFKKLVKQGEAFEERAKPTVADIKGKARQAKDKATDGWRKLEDAVEDKVSSALESAGVPRQHHIDDLKSQVDSLKAELDKLRGGRKPARRKTARKPAAKKTAAKKTAARKPAARKTAARKPGSKVATAGRPAAKKTAARKPAARKPATKRSGGTQS